MTRKTAYSVGVSLGFVLVVLFYGQVAAGEGEYDFASCEGWANCKAESPNYTGICCRPCTLREGRRLWDCRRVGAERQELGRTSAGQLPTGEATIAGIVTKEGVLQADKGREYSVAGVNANELQQNMGKKIEVKGTVQEAEGKVTIDVDAYQLMGYGPAVDVEASGSCGNWLNCDSRAPTFTGTCCRQCKDATGEKLWECNVFSVGEYFDLAEWTK